MVANLRRWARALIMHRDHEVRPAVYCRELNCTARGRGMDRIEYQIIECATHLLAIQADGLFTRKAFQRHVFRASNIGMNGCAGGQKRSKVKRLSLGLVALRDTQETT